MLKRGGLRRERESERMEGADLAVVQGGMVAAAAGTR